MIVFIRSFFVHLFQSRDDAKNETPFLQYGAGLCGVGMGGSLLVHCCFSLISFRFM